MGFKKYNRIDYFILINLNLNIDCVRKFNMAKTVIIIIIAYFTSPSLLLLFAFVRARNG